MAMPTDLQVVLGATGGVGQVLVQALAAQGAQVRAVNRSVRASVPASVEVMAADLTNRESTRAACQGATTVYHCAGVPYHQWATYMPVWLDNVISAVSATGAHLSRGGTVLHRCGRGQACALARQTGCAACPRIRRGYRPWAARPGNARGSPGPGLASPNRSGAHGAAVHCPGQ